MRGLRERIRLNEGHARLWTVLGGVAAVAALPLSIVLALAVTGDDPGEAGSGGIGTASAPTSSGSDGSAPPDRAAPDGGAASGAGGPGESPSAYEGQLTLRSGSGADLETTEVAEERTSGPNGDIDIHFDVAAGLRANGGNIFDDRGPQQEARSRCLQAVSEDRDGRGGAGVYGSGEQFCFRTSQGRIGWVRVNDVHGVYVDQEVVLNFRVWDAA